MIEVKGKLLNRKVQLLKTFLVPFLAIVGLVIYISLRGSGSRHRVLEPASLRFEFPLWLILLLAFLLFMIITLVFKIMTTQSIDETSEIRIDDREIIVERPRYKMTFKKARATRFRVSISRWWGLFFRTYYRIGMAKLKYKGDSYTFLFPIQDTDVEQVIRNQEMRE
jgi:hypothetical protein